MDTLDELGPIFTVAEAAQELRCSESHVYNLLRRGEIAYEQRGRRKLPIAGSVAAYRRRSTVMANSSSSASQLHPAHSAGGFRHLFQRPKRDE